MCVHVCAYNKGSFTETDLSEGEIPKPLSLSNCFIHKNSQVTLRDALCDQRVPTDNLKNSLL